MKTTTLFSSLATAAALLASVHAEEVPSRPDMVGQALDQNGAPAPAVSVMILAAGPRTGTSPLCPYNYPDCGKKAVTDAQGQFRLTSLDPAMDFCVIALAPGFEPFLNSKLLAGDKPIKIKLKARDLAALPPERHIFGRIIGPDGAPVVGAMISVEGVEQKSSVHWGGNDATDSMTISDGRGEFHLAGRKDFVAVQATVEAPGLAKRWARLEPGKALFLREKAGGTIRGRLTWRGEPLRGVTLGLATEERECGKFFNGLQTATDAEGRFVFQAAPAGLKFQLFGLMESLGKAGASFQTELVSPADGATIDLGELSAKPAFALEGRVVLTDGKPLPANTRLMLDRTAAWDTKLAAVDADGHFEIGGVPAELVNLNLDVAGYRLSEKNPSLDRGNRRRLAGRVGGDMASLNVVLEPGNPANWGEYEQPTFEESEAAKSKPLQGAP